jgi:hypothetical protein
LFSIFIDIFEPGKDYAAVTHVFNGKDKREATHYINSHKKTDKFLRDALDKGEFEGMELKVKRREVNHGSN